MLRQRKNPLSVSKAIIYGTKPICLITVVTSPLWKNTGWKSNLHVRLTSGSTARWRGTAHTFLYSSNSINGPKMAGAKLSRNTSMTTNLISFSGFGRSGSKINPAWSNIRSTTEIDITMVGSQFIRVKSLRRRMTRSRMQKKNLCPKKNSLPLVQTSLPSTPKPLFSTSQALRTVTKWPPIGTWPMKTLRWGIRKNRPKGRHGRLLKGTNS